MKIHSLTEDPLIAHRGQLIKLNPTPEQKTFLCRCFGSSRFAYNWALNNKSSVYKRTGISLSAPELDKRFNAIKDKKYPWVREVPAKVTQHAIRDLDKAYKNFFRRLKQGGPKGFPKFKKRRDFNGSANLSTNGRPMVKDGVLRATKDVHIKLQHEIRWPDAKQISISVS